MTEIRKVENLELSDSVFSLTDELFDASVSKTVKKLQATKNTLKTTIRYVDRIKKAYSTVGVEY